ncbi:hypothetical protein SKAU_G00404590 [Synaphobranchus kaupii]|uniref:Upstream-binding protein 1 n=1 Tax=Synaphobranchus kaupii TaxID=118154 RepID=A0A9Q1E9T3_SYNKA|nr:hypothetical protein SKAU_G00404590 [Synaphobranchus kaupii]
MEKRTPQEKEKYQASYETTILSEMRLDPIVEEAVEHEQKKSSKRTLATDYGDSLAKRGSEACAQGRRPLLFLFKDEASRQLHQYLPTATLSPVPDSDSSSPSHQGDVIGHAAVEHLAPSASLQEVQQWLHRNRFSSYNRLFAQFSGSDLLKLTREDLVQICGPADGIRLFNALKSRSVRPRLTVYVCQEAPQAKSAALLEAHCDSENGEFNSSAIFVYHALYLEEMTASELTRKIASVFNLSLSQISQVYRQGPTGIHIILSDQMVYNLQDESCFLVSTLKADTGDGYHVILK